MKKTHFVYGIITPFIAFFLSISLLVESQTNPSDASVMIVLRESLKPPKNFGWSNSDPCTWKLVSCSNDKRVTQIQIGSQNLQGTLPTDLRKLTALRRLELQSNQISGPLPSLIGLSSLQVLLLDNNNFSSIPSDFFSGLSSLQAVELDNNPFGAWEIPDSLMNATMLQNFSANSANVFGLIPDFFGFSFPSLSNLHLAFNNLEGELPATFVGSSMESMWLNGNKLNGGIEIIQNMTFLKQVWLHSNAFTGPLPNFSRLISLYNLNIRDNQFTGPVPSSLISLPGLQIVNLTNNLLQGPTPKFPDSVAVEMAVGTNRFCLPTPGDCDSRVNTILLIAKSLNYPHGLANVWKGNDPCSLWFGITCNGGNITLISIQKMGLVGTISPYFSLFKSLQKLILANNNLTGSIPEELTTLPALIGLDVSYNQLSGKVPNFRSNVIVNTNGNPEIENNPSPNTQSGGPPGSSSDKGSGTLLGVVLGSVFGGVCAIITLLGVLGFWLCKRKTRSGRVQSPNVVVIHPHHSGSADLEIMKISRASSGPSDIQVGEAGNMVIPIQVLRNITNNFSRENILGQGGFGTVYKGQLYDGMKIAVKRMDPGLMSGKGLSEFTSEIAILNKVRHRHLVALLGYCLDGNERLLIYEYMSQGTLSRHLFNWNEEGLRPLEWTRRLTIVLDVARGVEYLHGLAHQSFIHRDLKPSNILLGDDMRAKVSDFGLVRLAPEGKNSVETRIAGTFGYLAPEYAVTGRVTMKVDVFSFGVILMELITGRKALDESQPDESMHLVTWFRRMHINENTFRKAIDPTIDLTEETLASIRTVGDLAGHCCTWNSYQRPDMSHVVNVLSSLVELWKPSEPESEDMYGVDLDMTLPQALQQWQALEDNRHYDTASMDNNQTSVPTYLDGR